MILLHQGLELNRWFKFSLFEQLSNVACDVERAIEAKNKGDISFAQTSFERALELLSLTIIDPKNKGPKIKELARIREFLIDYFMYDNEYGSTDEFWQNYFMYFAYIAANARGR